MGESLDLLKCLTYIYYCVIFFKFHSDIAFCNNDISVKAANNESDMGKIFLFVLILILCTGAGRIFSTEDIEQIFKKSLPISQIVYTKVPRGLIISFDEKLFFNDCETSVKESSLYILDTIAEIVKSIPNDFVIEDHVQDNWCGMQAWELSMVRAANSAEYLVKCRNIPNEKIFDIGFGEFMPFYDNVNNICKKGVTGCAANLNNRIDFVIIEYDAKR